MAWFILLANLESRKYEEKSMNKCILMGRLTRDPEVRYTSGQDNLCIARYTLAVDRKFRQNNENTADFIPCVAFGKSGEFAEKYFRQGMRVTVSGRIQTGSYTNAEGRKVYTTEVIIEEQEFAESKSSSNSEESKVTQFPQQTTSTDGFMDVPAGLEEELPFN